MHDVHLLISCILSVKPLGHREFISWLLTPLVCRLLNWNQHLTRRPGRVRLALAGLKVHTNLQVSCNKCQSFMQCVRHISDMMLLLVSLVVSTNCSSVMVKSRCTTYWRRSWTLRASMHIQFPHMYMFRVDLRLWHWTPTNVQPTPCRPLQHKD